MPKPWFYSPAKQKVVGPCSSTELTRLAAAGIITPFDLIRGGRMGRPVQARQINGPFPAMKLHLSK